MKVWYHIALIASAIICFSCGHGKVKRDGDIQDTDSLQKGKPQLASVKKRADASENTDSLYLLKILDDAIKETESRDISRPFETNYVETMSDSSYDVEVSVQCDHFFTKEMMHTIIKRKTAWFVYIDIYSSSKNQFVHLLSHKQRDMTYTNDTICDVNGDGLKDFVVNWYGSSGCCLKAFSNVYLQRNDNKTFSGSFEFINPTFSPKEQIIRGVCYGQPGETDLYKYRWIGDKLDTIEYVSYEKDENGIKTGAIIISIDRYFEGKSIVVKRLKTVPAEYRSIEGYDWFTGKGYN